MGCNISVGLGTEFIRPDIVESRNQPPFFDSPFISHLIVVVLNSFLKEYVVSVTN